MPFPLMALKLMLPQRGVPLGRQAQHYVLGRGNAAGNGH